MTPTLLPEAARLYQQLAPVAQDDEQNGWATAHLCTVLTARRERIAALAKEQDGRPGFARLLNVDDCDAEDLPYLGYYNGTPLSGLEPEEEQRRRIREARGSKRGRPSAVISDLKATLTGTQSVALIERDGGTFLNAFVTLPAETPDEAASQAVLSDRQTKPLGVINTLITSTSPIWPEATKKWSEVAPTVTWANVKAGDV